MHFFKLIVFSCLLSLLSGCSTLRPGTAERETEGHTEDHPATEAVVASKPFPDESFYQLLVAEFAIRRQQYGLALENYINQAKQTRDLGVTATAARLAQFVDDEQATLEAVNIWLELAPEDRSAHYIAASALAKSRRPIEALPHMIKVLEDGAESNFAALAASVLTLPEEQQKEFLDELNRLLAEHPQERSLKTAKALMLQYRNRETEALALIREVLAEAPNDIHALLIETRLLQQLGREPEALERLAYAVDAHPSNKRLRLHFAQLLAKTDLHQAKAQFSVLVQQYPDDGNLLMGLALVNQELGEFQEAREQFEGLLRLATHNSQAHYFLGRLAEQRQDWQEAINHYLKVAPGEEFIPAVKHLIAIADEIYGLEVAQRHLASLRKLHPEQEIQLVLLESDLLFDSRAYEEGHQLLSEALEKHPQQINLLYARSLFSERRNNLPLLERDLRTILSTDPNNATALNALGYSLAVLTDRLDEARDLVKQALDIRPNDPAIQDSYGWIAFRLGDLQMAHNYLQKAFAQTRDHEIAAHLGEVLWQMNRHDEARQVWRDGLENKPDSNIIRETLLRLNISLD